MIRLTAAVRALRTAAPVRRSCRVMLGSVLVPALAIGCRAPRPPQVHTVSIRNFTFAPATIAAAPGDTIVWKNEDFVPHTATAKDSVFRSGDIAGGAVWRTVVAAAGHHEYICLYHPAMRAVVDVK